MRTVEKFLTYCFTEDEKIRLEILGVVNGCGAKGKFNFSDFIEKTKTFYGFDIEKFDALASDMRELCSFQHDVRFWEGGNVFDFFFANLEFVIAVTAVVHWTSFFRKAFAAIALMAGLTIFGKDAFSFGKKRSVRELLRNA